MQGTISAKGEQVCKIDQLNSETGLKNVLHFVITMY